jgi:hypothetical protein
MSVDLPIPVANYFRSENAHDANAVAYCFSIDAQVRDEGKIYQGRDAIRAWKNATSTKYAATITATGCKTTPLGCTVAGKVTGNFPGSPLMIDFDFKFGAQEIDALEITA